MNSPINQAANKSKPQSEHPSKLVGCVGTVDQLSPEGVVVRSWRVRHSVCSIGSGRESHIQIDGDGIAGTHVTLTFGRRHVVAKSASGFWVAGRAVREWLFDGATELQLGSRTIRVTPARALATHSPLRSVNTPENLAPFREAPPANSYPSREMEGVSSGARVNASTSPVENMSSILPTVEKVVQELVGPLRGAMEEIRTSVQEVVDRTSKPVPAPVHNESTPSHEMLTQFETNLVDRIEGRFASLLTEIERFREEAALVHVVPSIEPPTPTIDTLALQELEESQNRIREFEVQIQKLRDERDVAQRRALELANELHEITRSVDRDQQEANQVNDEHQRLLQQLSLLDGELASVHEAAEKNSAAWEASTSELQQQLAYWQGRASVLQEEVVRVQQESYAQREPQIESDSEYDAAQPVPQLSQPESLASPFEPFDYQQPDYQQPDYQQRGFDSENFQNGYDESGSSIESLVQNSVETGPFSESDLAHRDSNLADLPYHDPSPFDDSESHEPQYQVPSTETPQYEETQYEETQYEQTPSAESRYEESRYEESQYDESRYDESQSVESDSAELEHGGPQYDQNQYEQPQYEEGSFDSGLNGGGHYESDLNSMERESDSEESLFGEYRDENESYELKPEMDEPSEGIVRRDSDASHLISRSIIASLEEDQSEDEDYAEPQDQADEYDDYSTVRRIREVGTELASETPEPTPLEELDFRPSTVLETRKSSVVDEEEDSIEAYMKQLLQRVRGTSDSDSLSSTTRQTKGTVANVSATRPTGSKVTQRTSITENGPITRSKTEARTDSTPVAEVASSDSKPFDPASYTPRQQAPERNQNMAAMRDLANVTARRAIEKSDRRRLATQGLFKLSVAMIGLVGALFLLMINGFRVNMALVGTLAGLCIAGLWGWESIAVLSNLAKQPVRTPGGEAAGVGVGAPLVSETDHQ